MLRAAAIATALLAAALSAAAPSSATVVDLAPPVAGGSSFFTGNPRSLVLANVNNPRTPLDALVGTSNAVTGLGIGRTAVAGSWGMASPIQSFQSVEINGAAADLAVSDIDGDGLPDAAVADGNGVSVVRNNPSGTGVFDSSVVPTGATGWVSGVALARIDADALPDLVASANGVVQVFTNTGTTGFFSDTSPFDTQTGTIVDGQTTGVGAGDLDGDGDLDVAVATKGPTGDGRVEALLNSGGALDPEPRTAALFSRPQAVEVADVTGTDGRPEVLVTEPDDGTLAIVATNHLPTDLGPIDRVATGTSPVDVATGDLDGDGRLEIVTANRLGNSVTVISPGRPPRSFAAGADPTAVAIGEVTGDSLPDVVVANDAATNLTVLRNLGVPKPAPPATNPTPVAKPNRTAKLSCKVKLRKATRKRKAHRSLSCTVKLSDRAAARTVSATLKQGKRTIVKATAKPSKAIVLKAKKSLAKGKKYTVTATVTNGDKSKLTAQRIVTVR